MKKILVIILLVIALLITLVGCTQNKDESLDSLNKNVSVTNTEDEIQTEDRLSIVVSIFPQYDFTRAIIGDKADLTMLIKPGSESHSYDPSPADIIKIQNADAFIYIGGESEQWVKTILDSIDTTDIRVIRLMDNVNIVEEETVEGMEKEYGHEHSDDEHEDDHEEEIEYDEHIWTSPKNAILMINAIAETITELDVKNATIYSKNAEDYVKQIQNVDSEFRNIVNNSDNKLLVFGDRFPFRYFVDEYGLDYRAAFNGCSSETEASAGTIAYLIDTVKSNKLSHIFYIELSNQNIARVISEQTGAEMILLHSSHNVTKDDFEAGVTYLSIMKQNIETLRKGI